MPYHIIKIRLSMTLKKGESNDGLCSILGMTIVALWIYDLLFHTNTNDVIVIA